MYFFPKFCGICIKTGENLLDVETTDFDHIKLSEKLHECSKMDISNETLSTKICMACIKKLRISYQFQEMCKRSSQILQNYLGKLLGDNEEKDPKKFISDDLHVFVTPLAKCDIPCDSFYDQPTKQAINKRKQRITKGQRCSLLKQLLMPNKERLRKERDKTILSTNNNISDSERSKGGLKDIINFTQSYDFNCLDKNSNIKLTPLDKLKEFSDNFFKQDFSEFRNAILYVIENRDNLYESGTESDEEYFFNNNLEEAESMINVLKFEEILVEPDIKVKNEPMEYEEIDDRMTYGCVEAIYSDQLEVKQEFEEISETEILEQKYNLEDSLPNNSTHNNMYSNSYFNNLPQSSQSSSMQLLDNLVSSYSINGRKHFSPFNVRCRTRNNPYINPNIKQQFLHRSFKCDICNRYFKSQGYLKAHNSKVH